MMKSHVSVRLDAEAIARVDALIPQLQIEGRTATRSDVLRALVLCALDLQPSAVSASITSPPSSGASTTERESAPPRPPNCAHLR